MDRQNIFEKRRDLRLVTIRRGGTLNNSDHRLIAKWADECAQHMLHLFEEERPDDARLRIAIEQARAWGTRRNHNRSGRGSSSYGCMWTWGLSLWDPGCSRSLFRRSARWSRLLEFRWQYTQLPREIRDLVRSDQQLRNRKYWSLFTCWHHMFPGHPLKLVKIFNC